MRFAGALCVFLLLASCASVPTGGIADQSLAPGVTLSLPDGAPFGDLDVVQLVQARYQDRQQVFQSCIQAGAARFTLVMTVPSGPRIMRIDWRDGRIVAKKEPIAPTALEPERMMADIFLVYAPHEALVRALHGAQVDDTPDGLRRVRVLGHDVIVIKRPSGQAWVGDATLSNLAHGYVLNIQSRRIGP